MLGYLSKLRDLTAKAGGPFAFFFGRGMAEDLGHFRDQNYLCVCIYIYMGMDQYLLIPFLVG